MSSVKTVHIQMKSGNKPMTPDVPSPTGQVPQPKPPVVAPEPAPTPVLTPMAVADAVNPSVLSVTVVGCGGGGINSARPFLTDKRAFKTLYFDTSMTNTRPNENAFVVTNGSGSGSNRAENARDIERVIPQIPEDKLGISDVAIVMFSLAGGSGSVLGPLLIREYARRGMRVIGVAIADTSYSVGAKNTLNTLKTLTAIATNNGLYLPMIILSNDHATNRGAVDASANALISNLLDILTSSVYEVDRNDRLNWISPLKVISTTPGIKLMTFSSENSPVNNSLVLGTDSNEMIDSLLILQSSPDDTFEDLLPPTRLKKTGFYTTPADRLIGKVSSDISSVESIIDKVEKMEQVEAGNKHQTINRLSNTGDSDLIL